MKITSATFPPHIAKAYGVRPAQQAVTVVQTSPTERTDAIAKIAPAAHRAADAVERLVAQVVPGSVAFTDDGTAVPKAPALPIYTRPADRNAAATGIAVGASIDVSG